MGRDTAASTSAEASNGPQGEAQKSNDWLTPNMPEDSIQQAFGDRWSWSRKDEGDEVDRERGCFLEPLGGGGVCLFNVF